MLAVMETGGAPRLVDFDPADFGGLSEAEAAERLRREGPNVLPSAGRRGLLSLALETIREPMILLLVAAGGIYLMLGDRQEAVVLLASVVGVVAISLAQTYRTERALEVLRDLSAPRALVVRDGRQRRIAGHDVVRGDTLVLSEGDRVAADGRLLWCRNLSVDESLLTGESVPVGKSASPTPVETARPGGEDLPFVYSGTLVVRGQGLAEAVSTGAGTEMGRIGRALETLEPEPTWLQRETARLVRVLATGAIGVCLLVAVAYGLTRGSWLNGLLVGVTLAMSLLPEELPVVLAVFFAMGAWRMSRRGVLTRRLPAIETLGSATVLCADKTGTLTENRMAVRALTAGDRELRIGPGLPEELPEELHALVEHAILASQRDPFDPMELAIRRLGLTALAGTDHLHADWGLVREYPLSPELFAMSHVWRSPGGEELVISAKGAPEAIVDLCHLGPEEAARVRDRVEALAAQGLRVLAIATASLRPGSLPAHQHGFDFRFVGLLGLEDPVRPSAAAAVRSCRDAGVRVVMITGDYPGTARHVAEAIGLDGRAVVATGPELDAMTDAELSELAGRVSLFARVVPEQKLRLVRALESRGEVVAMTGDGVNDAPALKAAQIGIALGSRGTDVAREAASLILVEDDFASMVEAVRSGRRIFENLQKAAGFLVAVHVPIAGLAIVPVLAGWPLALLPVHVVFLELIIDPVCAVAFEAEPEEEDVMKRPPREPATPLLSRRAATAAVLHGLVVLAAAVGVYGLGLGRFGEPAARALAFSTLVVADLGIVLTSRSRTRTIRESLGARNPALWWVVCGAAGVLALALAAPPAREIFRFGEVGTAALAAAVLAGIASVLPFELAKLARRRGSSPEPVARVPRGPSLRRPPGAGSP